jgi:hypothetical protein
MFNRIRSRALASGLALASLVAGSVLIATTPANASGIGAVSPSSFYFQRASSDGNTLLVKAGEYADITSNIDVTTAYSGWPLKKGVKLTRTAYSVTAPAAMPIYDNGYRSWYGNDEAYDCELYSNDASYTTTSANRCVTDLFVSDVVTVNNLSGTDQTVTTNASSQVLKVGSTNITNKSGVDKTFFAGVNTNATSMALTSSETNLNMYFRGCIDESLLLSNSEDLKVLLTVTRNGSTLTRGTDYSAWDNGDGSIDTEATNMVYTTISAGDYADQNNGGLRENLEINLGVSLDSQTSGTFTGTLDVQNSSDQSVLEACPLDGVATWGEYDQWTGGNPAASIHTRSMPSSVDETNSNFDVYGSANDGFGGQFYYTYDANDYVALDNANATIVHRDESGPQNDFNNTGSAVVTSGAWGNLDLGRYTLNGASWYGMSVTGKNYTLTTGSMSGAAFTQKTYTAKALSAICPTSYSANWVTMSPAPTTYPLAFVSCNYKGTSALQLAFLKPTGVQLVTSLGTTTSKKPCLVPMETTNPLATTGTDVAFMVYSRTGTKDSNGNCGSDGATISTRALTTITSAGTATKTTLVGNPWPDGIEPQSLTWAPVDAAGLQWIGLTYIQPDMYTPSYADHSFTATKTAISANPANIALDGGDNFGDWAWLQPVKKIDATHWAVALDGSTVFDGELTAKYTVGILNPSTGQVTNGDVATLTGFGYFSGRVASSMSIKPGDAAYWYATTSRTEYAATKWTYTP